MLDFFVQHHQALLFKTWEHLYISALSLIAGIAVAVPSGVFLARSKRLSGLFMGLASIFQTIPSLALLTVMIPFLGVGKPPAIAALFVYSLLPILRNTCIGIQGVDAGVVDAARGKGGGYRLSKPPENYTAGEIVSLAEGDLAPVACLKGDGQGGEKADQCLSLPLWQGLDRVVMDYLNRYSLADLLGRELK